MKNDMRALYPVVRDITGTRNNASTPMKDISGHILLNINKQDLCWIEHFKETLNKPEPTVTHNFSMDDSHKELTLNLDEITTKEVWDTAKALKDNKHLALNQITTELLKNGEDTVVVELTNLMNKYWQIEAV